jgi:hypothetical protein
MPVLNSAAMAHGDRETVSESVPESAAKRPLKRSPENLQYPLGYFSIKE